MEDITRRGKASSRAGAQARTDTRNAFTLLRIIAATLVLITHSYVVLGKPSGDPFERMHLVGLSKMGVDAFFVISGFLVTLSMLRNRSLSHFCVSRGLRILPGLAVVVVLSVFAVGPIVTTEAAYFTDLRTWGYLRNIGIFDQQPLLPGVFTVNPVAAVNGSLWTLPIEVLCYGGLIVATWARMLTPRALALIAVVMLYLHLHDTFERTKFVFGVADLSLNEFGYLFTMGALLATIKDRLRPSYIVTLMMGLAVVVSFLENKGDWHTSALVYLVFWPYMVVTTALGLKWAAPLNRLDISYGVYIYGFVVQQVLAMVMPHAHTGLFMAASILASYAMGTLSWLLIEKPALRLKRLLVRDTAPAAATE